MSQFIDGANDTERDELTARGFDFFGYHPFRISSLAGSSQSFSGPELVRAQQVLGEALWRAVSTQVPGRVLLEEAIVELT